MEAGRPPFCPDVGSSPLNSRQKGEVHRNFRAPIRTVGSGSVTCLCNRYGVGAASASGPGSSPVSPEHSLPRTGGSRPEVVATGLSEANWSAQPETRSYRGPQASPHPSDLPCPFIHSQEPRPRKGSGQARPSLCLCRAPRHSQLPEGPAGPRVGQSRVSSFGPRSPMCQRGRRRTAHCQSRGSQTPMLPGRQVCPAGPAVGSRKLGCGWSVGPSSRLWEVSQGHSDCSGSPSGTCEWDLSGK